MVKKREFVTCLILTFVTCGIYGIYWMISMTDDVRILTKDNRLPSGGACFLLTLVTCGIYGFYWAYQMGKILYDAKVRAGMNDSDNSVLFLVLQLLGLGIVNYYFIQKDINNMVDVIGASQANAGMPTGGNM